MYTRSILRQQNHRHRPVYNIDRSTATMQHGDFIFESRCALFRDLHVWGTSNVTVEVTRGIARTQSTVYFTAVYRETSISPECGQVTCILNCGIHATATPRCFLIRVQLKENWRCMEIEFSNVKFPNSRQFHGENTRTERITYIIT